MSPEYIGDQVGYVYAEALPRQPIPNDAGYLLLFNAIRYEGVVAFDPLGMMQLDMAGRPLEQWALGTEIKVPTLDGEHTLKLPEGTQTHTVFKIRNKGLASLNGHGKGDLYVEVRVQIPGKLSKRQKELLQELETTARVDNQPLMRALLGKVKDMFG